METYIGPPQEHCCHHYGREVTSVDCTADSLLSHDSQDHTIYDTWTYRPDSHTSVTDSELFSPFLSSYLNSGQDEGPQDRPSYFLSDIYSSPPPTTSALKQPVLLPHLCAGHFMDDSDSHSDSEQLPCASLLGLPHSGFYRPQPPSPPLETPELVQRSLPDASDRDSQSTDSSPLCLREPSPVLLHEASDSSYTTALGTRSYPCGHDEDPTGPSKRLRRWSGSKEKQTKMDVVGLSAHRLGLGAQISPLGLLSPETPMTVWPAPAMLYSSCDDSDHEQWDDDTMHWAPDQIQTASIVYDASAQPSKPRGLSLDSANLEDFDLIPNRVPRPPRSYTTPPKFKLPELRDSWESCSTMEVDEPPPHSPRPNSLLLPLDGFDLGYSFATTSPESAHALDSGSESAPLPSLFDDACTVFTPIQVTSDYDMDDIPTAPSSPRSPLMQLTPDGSFDVPSDGTISPSLLGPPSPGEGLGLFVDDAGVDPPFARSPSPSDYELQILESQVDITVTGLPENEYKLLRAYYDTVNQAELAARERESALDRRVKDISALLDPAKVVSDTSIMHTRRQELRQATDIRAEVRKSRKREKHRKREIGAILDLKLDLGKSVFQGKGSMRSVPQLVANMVLKRRDVCRSLANRKTASSAKTMTPSPLRTFFTCEDVFVMSGVVAHVD